MTSVLSDNVEQLDPQRVAATFNHAASSYNHYAQLQREVADNLLDRLDDFKLPPLHCIADVGCGSGYLSHQLQQRYPQTHILGYDLAQALLQQAQQQHRSAWWQWQRPRVQFICADAARLPLADNSVDLLLSNLMLQWCDDVRAVFAELARVLKPNGILLFSTFGPDTLKELRHSWAQADGTHSHVNRFIDMHDLGDALLAAGVLDPVMDTDWIVRTYRDVFHLMAELKGIGAHNITHGRQRGLTGKRRFRAMLEAYRAFQRDDGHVPATYEVVYGHAIGKDGQAGFAAAPGAEVHIPLSHIGGRR